MMEKPDCLQLQAVWFYRLGKPDFVKGIVAYSTTGNRANNNKQMKICNVNQALAVESANG